MNMGTIITWDTKCDLTHATLNRWEEKGRTRDRSELEKENS